MWVRDSEYLQIELAESVENDAAEKSAGKQVG